MLCVMSYLYCKSQPETGSFRFLFFMDAPFHDLWLYCLEFSFQHCLSAHFYYTFVLHYQNFCISAYEYSEVVYGISYGSIVKQLVLFSFLIRLLITSLPRIDGFFRSILLQQFFYVRLDYPLFKEGSYSLLQHFWYFIFLQGSVNAAEWLEILRGLMKDLYSKLERNNVYL